STLIGRLLFETKAIFEDQFSAVEKTSKKRGQSEVDLALLLDGLSAEREQGITIDVAYRYFETPNRKFIIADTPGHEQYTRNMVTGASTAELAIILIDARNGVMTQSKRHGFLVSLLQIPHMIVAVNKMDLVDYSQDAYDEIVEEYKQFSQKLDIHDITFIPVSALKGDNVVERSPAMPWYNGFTLLHYLENVHVMADKNLIDFRFPVQYVIRPHLDFRGYAGRVVSGTISPGEEIVALPSGKTSTVKSITTWDGDLKEAFASQSVVLTLADEIDVSRGDMIVRKNNIPHVSNRFEAILCWMDEKPFSQKTQYFVKQMSRTVKAYVSKMHYRIDVNTLHREQADTLNLNEIARVEITTSQPLFFDSYKVNGGTGSFILIDPDSNLTSAAGMIRGPVKELDNVIRPSQGGSGERRHSTNVTWQGQTIPPAIRESRNGHKSVVLWLTGYSGAGKSTVAKTLEKKLFDTGCQTMLLDGDNIRHGLCGDLGFSEKDRNENIRRVAEVARLFFENGRIVLCTFISPLRSQRDYARSIIPEGRFFEVFVKCDLSVCKRRDPKGLYQKAKDGDIADFTGVSSPYEEPENPEITVETDLKNADEIVGEIIERLLQAKILEH
ncbi:MAG: sulfate adenylyltransferase subunit CysN, partial [Chitinivibrionales bacterium]|nr:sulfate adenylyltransferase subunit CysN [Chitinivibrionales bacterium]